MTKEEIIHMATEAWGIPCIDDAIALLGEDGIERFAALIASRVAAASASVEREACAKVCEQIAIGNEKTHANFEQPVTIPKECAAAIRARGNDDN